MRTFAFLYGLGVGLSGILLWLLANMPQNTGIGVVDLFGAQALVITGKAFIVAILLWLLVVLGGLGLAAIAAIELMRQVHEEKA